MTNGRRRHLAAPTNCGANGPGRDPLAVAATPFAMRKPNKVLEDRDYDATPNRIP